ncbi:helix-turn-helix transcriptional regulator [Pseudomonas sp. Sample_23]|uniref:helix-turn-helix domain-containing protein n=1 Tax=Pseudomonas sp. Sample_23 TaxID=2448267 RepID=UPI0010328F85|nr:helix-turn-helix transcriptional regulator [Pseudomonas sp. Sample_23]
MSAEIVNFSKARSVSEAAEDAALLAFFQRLPATFSARHCSVAREMLDWSIEALAFRSSVSVKAIKDLESGTRKLNEVTMQALAYAFENEGLIFIPGHPPSKGENCRGATTDPKQRDDFHLIE